MFLLKFVHFRLMDIFFTVDQKVANILMSLHGNNIACSDVKASTGSHMRDKHGLSNYRILHQFRQSYQKPCLYISCKTVHLRLYLQ